ncbi:MAG: molecular chaperone HtpG [Clostridia bacterium]|nr:molecular chaperone HtpG [Clostridia bacterium]
MATKGNISIHAQNIMPVIKRWLYSDKDIFIRELVSNGCDAITKYKMLKGDTGEDLRVTVTVDKDNRTLTFTDNGIGMTAEEVDKYINQVAFSSAEEFLKNYTGEEKGGIIGHFGLGFYSAFMAAEKVTIDTLSWQEGAEPVLWQSEDGMAFTMEQGSRTQRGTTIVLHVSEEEKEFCETFRVREVLERYCGFMATPIYLVDVNKEEKHEEGCDCEECHDHEEKPVNDVNPLWLKNPRECTEEEYKDTYKKVFHTFEEPLFWVHLNVDYPFNLKGILYFPRIRKDFGGQEGQIKLFNRQVFVADNIKEVIPEFLMLLKGVLDCPDLPLNVSRSFLQNDGYVKKLSAHITKKVADKLNGLFNTERKQYETYWDDIHPFVKYGCIRDKKFYDMVKPSILYKTTEGEYLTLDEYKARNEGKADKKVFYTTEQNRQAAAVSLYTQKGMDVAVMDTLIDMNFMSFMEFGGDMNETRFVRVDADVSGLTEDSEEGKDIDLSLLEKLFKEALSDDTLTVKMEALADHDLPLLLTEDEQMRRYKEMSAMYGQGMDFPAQYTLILNRLCPTIRSLAAMENEETAHLICRQLFDIARLSSRPLEAKELQDFLARSHQLLSLLADKA